MELLVASGNRKKLEELVQMLGLPLRARSWVSGSNEDAQRALQDPVKRIRFTLVDDAGKETFPGYPHKGLPNQSNFGWVQVGPQRMEGQTVDVTEC